MTWSILARDPATGAFGVAVATKFFAVGALCPHASGAGALATQALVNPTFGPRGLRLLAEGIGAPHVVAALIEGDEGRDTRQLHVLDRNGLMAAYTGAACVDWCGHRIGEGFSVAGNMLAGPQVVDAAFETYAAGTALPFPRRLVRALKAGEDVGGDKRGKQSAGLLVFGDELWAELDIRVDDHPEPIDELLRLEAVSRERYVHFRKVAPRRADRVGETDWQVIDATISDSIRRAEEEERSRV
jgi:uncharacterized Ntn-hydrolase superfamily protein